MSNANFAVTAFRAMIDAYREKYGRFGRRTVKKLQKRLAKAELENRRLTTEAARYQAERDRSRTVAARFMEEAERSKEEANYYRQEWQRTLRDRGVIPENPYGC